jgi:hypothetical protein
MIFLFTVNATFVLACIAADSAIVLETWMTWQWGSISIFILHDT